jgi:hypothetical protein
VQQPAKAAPGSITPGEARMILRASASAVREAMWLVDLILKGVGLLFGVFLKHKEDVSRDAGRPSSAPTIPRRRLPRPIASRSPPRHPRVTT